MYILSFYTAPFCPAPFPYTTRAFGWSTVSAAICQSMALDFLGGGQDKVTGKKRSVFACHQDTIFSEFL